MSWEVYLFICLFVYLFILFYFILFYFILFLFFSNVLHRGRNLPHVARPLYTRSDMGLPTPNKYLVSLIPRKIQPRDTHESQNNKKPTLNHPLIYTSYRKIPPEF